MCRSFTKSLIKTIARLVADHIIAELEKDKSRLTFQTHIMYKVAADHAPVNCKINVSATDSEGNPATIDPSKLSINVTSSNPSLVNVEIDEDGDPTTAIVSFGSPSANDADIASVEAEITYDGEVVDIVGAQFIVVAGDPESFGGSTMTFEGLNEEPV